MKSRVLKGSFAALLGATMILGSVPSFAAVTETKVFEDSFENLSDNGTLAAGIPELKVYGEDVMNGDGTFETGVDGSKQAWYGGAGVNFTSNVDAWATENHSWEAHGGNNYVWVSGRYYGNKEDGSFTYKFPAGTEFKKGVYELSVWVRGFVHNSVPTSDGKTLYVKWNGNYDKWISNNIDPIASCFASTELSTNEWREIKCYIPFSDDYTVESGSEPTFSLSMEQFASGDAVTRRYWVDDITMKKVENCDLVSAKEINARANLSRTNLPYYKLSLAAGKTAVLTYPVENQTAEPVDVTVISALYDQNGALVNILNQTKETIEANAQTTITDTVAIPDGIDDTYSLKYYLWDSLGGLHAYADKRDSADVDFINVHSDTIPNTNGWKITSAKNRYLGQQVAAESMDRVVSGAAHSGVNSLYIPYPISNETVSNPTLAESGSAAYVMTDTLKANTTYRLKFYAKPVGQVASDFFAIGVAKGDMRELRAHADSAWLSNLKLIYTDADGSEQSIGQGDVTIDGIRYLFNVGYGASKISRLYTGVPKEWKEYTFEFTTTDESSYSLDFQTALNGSFNKSNFGGVYIDDVRVYEVTDSGESAE